MDGAHDSLPFIRQVLQRLHDLFQGATPHASDASRIWFNCLQRIEERNLLPCLQDDMLACASAKASFAITAVMHVEYTFSAWKESRPVVGSSKKSSMGLASSSHPMLKRFFSPPERPRFLASPADT